MKKTEFNETQIKDIVERYKNGEAIMNIRKDYNVSHSTINRVLKENNVAIRGNRKHFYNEDILKKINTAEKAY
jgi:intein-encoded DNA endonuclease-like protein